MSDTDQTTPQDTPEGATTAPEAVQEETPNREAARYRKALRDAEAERDQLKAQRDELARSIAEQSLPGNVPPRLMWEHTEDVTTLFDDAGRVDPSKVTAAAGEIIDAYGISPLATVPIVPNAGDTPDGSLPSGWADVVRGRHEVDDLM